MSFLISRSTITPSKFAIHDNKMGRESAQTFAFSAGAQALADIKSGMQVDWIDSVKPVKKQHTSQPVQPVVQDSVPNQDTEVSDYFKACERHDWYYTFSDDHGVWKRGQSALNALIERYDGNPKLQSIFDAFCAHMNSGESWGTVQTPKPVLTDFV